LSTQEGSNVAVLQAPRQSNSIPAQHELERILRLKVPVIVKLAERKLTMSEVLRLGVGAIIEFSKASDEPLELLINNKPIGVGEAVKVGENFGLRITQVGDVKSVIRSMGSE
jgi:flagellar motor switch protein FliN/FliY